LVNAVHAGDVSRSTVTESARRVIRLIERVGGFVDPVIRPEQELDRPEHRALIRRAGAEGCGIGVAATFGAGGVGRACIRGAGGAAGGDGFEAGAPPSPGGGESSPRGSSTISGSPRLRFTRPGK